MAVIRNTAAMRLKGSVGNTTYYVQGRRQIARVSQNSSNYGESARRSPAQQRRRVLWANLVNFYKVSANWMKGAFETKAANETDYNKFMSVNLPVTRVALTKEQAAQGCCLPDSYTISQGTMRHINIARSANTASMDIVMNYSTEQLADLNVGQFSSLLIEWNPWLYNGCQLSFMIYAFDMTTYGFPKITFSRAELCIDKTDQTPLKDLPIGPYLGSAENFLTWNQLDEDAYIAVILSDSTTGTLKVSTQQLIPGDSETVASYATPEKVEAAMQTYGVDEVRFLDSGYE